MVHRARQGFVEARTATLNRIRGLLAEFGIVLPLKAEVVRREAARHLEDPAGLEQHRHWRPPERGAPPR
jgi:transposase